MSSSKIPAQMFRKEDPEGDDDIPKKRTNNPQDLPDKNNFDFYNDIIPPVDGELCGVCNRNLPTHTFVPCGHTSICRSCGTSGNVTRCPMCFSRFQMIFRFREPRKN